MFKSKRKHQPKKFDVHRTLANPNRTYKAPTYGELQTLKSAKDRPEKKKRWLTWKKALLLLFIILLIPVLVIGVWDYRNYSKASRKMFGSGNLWSALPPNSIKNKDGRTNLLLAGFSTDDPGHDGAALTDSIMVMSLDEKSKTGYMLSIPRDLYVDIPGLGYRKINETYQHGQQTGFRETGYAKGGMGMLAKVVSRDFDLPIHYYVLINYGAVKDTVSALGGITVTIDSKDPRGIYDANFLPEEGGALKLKNGRQKIDAETALKLTRARGSTYKSYGFNQADFDRTKNQQTVIKGIKEKITWQLLLDPRKNPPLLDAIASNIKTDLKVSNVLPLYRLFSSIPDDKLKSVGLRDEKRKVNLLGSYRTPSGQSALIPTGGLDDYSEIQVYIKRLND
ncbi:MAG TPA: LCP family protein [Candidatus Saccharimonadales bacterium]|nr:LCP family protein [Candidatus Saccharimonadales bacterium]